MAQYRRVKKRGTLPPFPEKYSQHRTTIAPATTLKWLEPKRSQQRKFQQSASFHITTQMKITIRMVEERRWLRTVKTTFNQAAKPWITNYMPKGLPILLI